MRVVSFRIGRIFGFAWVISGLLLIPPAMAAIETIEDMDRIFNAFYTRPLDLDTVYAADGFQLTKDAMTFVFEKGDLFLMKPVNGEVTGAFFIGNGEGLLADIDNSHADLTFLWDCQSSGAAAAFQRDLGRGTRYRGMGQRP